MFLLLLDRAYTEPRPLLLLTLTFQKGGWGCMGGGEKTQQEQVTWNDQRDVPDHMSSCSVYKAWEEGGRSGECLERWRNIWGMFVFPIVTFMSTRRRELIPCFALLVCAALQFLLSKFSSYYHSSSVSNPTGEGVSERLAWWSRLKCNLPLAKKKKKIKMALLFTISTEVLLFSAYISEEKTSCAISSLFYIQFI